MTTDPPLNRLRKVCAEVDHPNLIIWLYSCQHTAGGALEVSIGTCDEPGNITGMDWGPFDDLEAVERAVHVTVELWFARTREELERG